MEEVLAAYHVPGPAELNEECFNVLMCITTDLVSEVLEGTQHYMCTNTLFPIEPRDGKFIYQYYLSGADLNFIN